jgi:hypothetical protein
MKSKEWSRDKHVVGVCLLAFCSLWLLVGSYLTVVGISGRDMWLFGHFVSDAKLLFYVCILTAFCLFVCFFSAAVTSYDDQIGKMLTWTVAVCLGVLLLTSGIFTWIIGNAG